MSQQFIQFEFDKDAVWARIGGRLSVFLDSNCWIHLADGKEAVHIRIRDRLRTHVRSGRLFCPLSWGTLKELFEQSQPSLLRTASLMEELSLNAIFVMRTELFAWEFSRALTRFLSRRSSETLSGLFAPPAAYVGSSPGISLALPGEVSLSPALQANAKAFMRRELSAIGVTGLAKLMGGRNTDKAPPGYSQVAKKVREIVGGDKTKLFAAEAQYAFQTYILPLMSKQSPEATRAWCEQCGPAEDENAWLQGMCADLPALHNFIDVMVVASSQPDRKDNFNHFMDNEIMAAPLAYADVFVSADRAIKDIACNRTSILRRSRCHYCDNLDALEAWLVTITA